MPPDSFAGRTVAAISDDAFADTPVPLALDETSYFLGRLAPHALDRLATFFEDLASRHPFITPTWAPHQVVIEALASDIRRRLAADEG